MKAIPDDPVFPTGPVFWRALRTALGRAPLLLIAWLLPFLLGGVLAAPWMSWFGRTLAHRAAPGSVLASMDTVFRQDHAGAIGALRTAGGASAALLALVSMWIGVFLAGGWLQVFLERTEGHSVKRFLWGGAKYFWRFLRVWVLSLVGLAVLAWLLHGWPWNTLLHLLLGAESMDDLEVVTSEWTAVWATWIQAGLFALGFSLLLAWGDYTRTRIALQDGHSAVWAGICSFFLILVHPIRTLRPFLLLFLCELAVVVLVGIASWNWNTAIGPASGWVPVLVLFLLGQFVMLWQTLCRASRYCAAVQVSRALVAPLSRPDPWGSRIGGPGGPQYPIDDTDDYNVSI
ncbi:MAG TPA: hypothetical protein ENJ09_12055 [Planctomycetes bacterium]|nr:hypothetical protein [Planctomycetota bacterium]